MRMARGGRGLSAMPPVRQVLLDDASLTTSRMPGDRVTSSKMLVVRLTTSSMSDDLLSPDRFEHSRSTAAMASEKL